MCRVDRRITPSVSSGLNFRRGAYREMQRTRKSSIAAATTAACLLAACAPVSAHFFVSPLDRLCASPETPGVGWRAEVFLGIPDNWAGSLLSAETYVAGLAPDFTFKTPYVDFPAGPEDSLLDADVAGIGAFLGGGITDVSDPAALNQPIGNFLIRFSALVDVRIADSTLGVSTMPVLLDFGTQGYGGYRMRLGSTSIYRVQNHVFNGNNPFFTENALVHGLGLFPITFTYYNRFDPQGANGHERVGVELYSFHPGGLPWPAGLNHFDPIGGYMTLAPPTPFYQPGDQPALARGDFDRDGAISLADFAAAQRCHTGDGGVATNACLVLDYDNDGDVDLADIAWLLNLLAGPAECALLPGDYDADNRIDLDDVRWFQWCVTAGGDEDRGTDQRGGLRVGCEAFDFDANSRIDLADWVVFQLLLFGPTLNVPE